MNFVDLRMMLSYKCFKASFVAYPLMFILVAWLQHMQLSFQHSLFTEKLLLSKKNCITTGFPGQKQSETFYYLYFIYYLLFIFVLFPVYYYLQNN